MTLAGRILNRLRREIRKLSALNPWKDSPWFKLNVEYKAPFYRFCHKRRIAQIRRRGHANVVIFAINLPMWRYQGIYEKLSQDSRFTVSIVLCPSVAYDTETNNRNMDSMAAYLSARGMSYFDVRTVPDAKSLMKELDADILFYPQPYDGVFGNACDYRFHKRRLLAYIPYGVLTVNNVWAYNEEFQNIAWKLFYPTIIHKQNTGRMCFNKGINVAVVGEPHADDLAMPLASDPWKAQDVKKKRIIYAPHFSLAKDGWLHRACFLWSWDVMKYVAEHYSDRVQIAFKPHPRLLSELYSHEDWGKERADAYFNFWKSGANTQIEVGEYIELFKSSDALIHDCGSFSAEYQYTGKPCMFLTQTPESVPDGLDPFGTKCFEMHYVGRCREEIIRFVEDVVLESDDPMKAQRDEFRKDFLVPPHGKTAALNTYEDIVRSVWGSV